MSVLQSACALRVFSLSFIRGILVYEKYYLGLILVTSLVCSPQANNKLSLDNCQDKVITGGAVWNFTTS